MLYLFVHIHTENVDQIHQAALSGHRSNNPYRVLKAVVDMMKQRYCVKKYTPLDLEEILTEVNLTDLKTDLRLWLSEVGTVAVNKWEVKRKCQKEERYMKELREGYWRQGGSGEMAVQAMMLSWGK